MTLISRLARGAFALRADSGEAAEVAAGLDDRYYDSWSTAAFGAGMRISPESVKRIGAAQSCTRVISRAIGMFPKKVLTESTGGKRVAKECPEYKLLSSRPNDRHTAYEFFEMLQAHYELHGNAYAEKKMNRFDVTQQLLPMHPARVTPEVLSNGRMRYRYADPLTSTTRILVQDEVFHLRNWSDDGYVGQSTIAMGSDIFGVALAAQDYSARFFQNDTKPSHYFVQTGANKFKTEQDKEAFRENFGRAQTGRNRHKVAVIPAGLELKEFSIKPSDAQLLDARKFSRIEICSIFGVPPHLIGETEKAATYASVEQFNIMYSTQCLLPRVVAWEQAIQRDILQDESYSVKFSMAAILRGDTASRTAAYAVAIQNGWLCQNDVRLLEDMDPVEGGDTYWRPLAWTPIGNLTNPQPAGSGGSNSTELNDLEDDANKKALADLRHNVHVLAAMAGKSGPKADALLQTMR